MLTAGRDADDFVEVNFVVEKAFRAAKSRVRRSVWRAPSGDARAYVGDETIEDLTVIDDEISGMNVGIPDDIVGSSMHIPVVLSLLVAQVMASLHQNWWMI